MKLPVLRRRPQPQPQERQLGDWWSSFTFGGIAYPYGYQQSPSLASKQEEIGSSFAGYVQGAYKQNGPVFACILVRMLLFAEARFKFRNQSGDLFGTQALQLLERPWPNGTTRDLLSRAEQDASLAGNFYCVVRPGPRLARLRPDWVTIVLAEQQGDPDAQIVGYLYQPGGKYSGRDPYVFRVEEVAHYAPIPDPEASYRGMSWLQPIVQEILADRAATDHKLKFFENGGTPSMIGKLNIQNQETFDRWVKIFREQNEGVSNAYKTLWLGAGADVEVVGADMKQLDFKITQGAGETRIAAAAGVPPVLVGLSEGLQAATYSNYGMARRRFADGTMRPLWGQAAASLAPLVQVPGGAELWYDDSQVAFIREDLKDQAEITFTQMQAIRQGVDGGFIPDTVIDGVTSNDLTRLKHSGLTSVQLVPPTDTTPTANGSGNPEQVPAPA